MADFATALQARYEGKSGSFRSQGLVYRRASLGLFVNRIYRQMRLTLTPRLHLSFQTAPRQVFRLSANQTLERFRFPLAAVPPTLPALPTPALTPVAISAWRGGVPPFLETDIHSLEVRRVLQETSRLAVQVPTQMIQRLAARLERVETVRRLTLADTHEETSVSSARKRFSQSLPMVLPIPQVTLHRTQAIRVEEDQRPETRSQPAIRNGISNAPLPELASFPPTDMHIHRLADQVVQVINDRVTARQERFGRI
jgi:hypothetical protein